jgi:hypothetical protein
MVVSFQAEAKLPAAGSAAPAAEIVEIPERALVRIDCPNDLKLQVQNARTPYGAFVS